MSLVSDDLSGKVEEEFVLDWSRKPPWQGIGVDVEPGTMAETYLKAAKLDWRVEKVRYTYHHNGKDHKSSKIGLVKSDDSFELTTISGGWEPVQNIDMFTFIDKYVDVGGMTIEIVGQLKFGRRVWALASMSQVINVFDGDIIKPYFLFTIPHEYGCSTDLRFLPFRIESLSAMNLTIGDKDIIKINHRRKFDPAAAVKMLEEANQTLFQYEQNIIRLGNTKAEKDDVIQYFRDIFPSAAEKNKSEKLSRPAKAAIKALEMMPGAKYAKGSWWAALNSVMFVIDHMLSKNVESRLVNSWYGQNRVKKVNALHLALMNVSGKINV